MNRLLTRTRTQRNGFTLLETALAMIIVTTGVLAIMEAQGAFIRSNRWSSQEATATYLASEIRERLRTLPRHDPVTGLTLGGGGVPVGLGPENGEVTVDDFDDIDDYNNVLFGVGGTFAGPIDAFGEVIPEVGVTGAVVMSGGTPVSMVGWSQYVEVEKVSPTDFSNVRPWNEIAVPNGSFPGRTIDQYPVRVTVTVFYQGPYDTGPQSVASMSWVAPY